MNRLACVILVIGVVAAACLGIAPRLFGDPPPTNPTAEPPASESKANAMPPTPADSPATALPANVTDNRAAVSAAPEKPSVKNGPVVRNCLISLIEDAQVPASEAGAIVEFLVHEGQQVKTDMVVARIDDGQPQAARKVASLEHRYAAEKAANDVDVRYARIAAKVAEAEYLKSKDANRKVPGSITEVELDRLKLAWQKAELEIEQSLKDRMLAACNADAKAAEVEAADVAIARRLVKAPIDGVVAQINVHRGEWVKPGDPLMRLVRIDRLRVEGFLNVQQSNPIEIDERKVVVNVDLDHSRHLQFAGKIVFVSPLVEAGGEYRVTAEVENLQENGRWVLRPGLTATMTVELPAP